MARARATHTRVGVGGRMDTLQCAVVLAKVERFEWELQRRQEIGARYGALLDAAGIERVTTRADRDSVLAQYTVFVDDRARVQAALAERGIPTAVHYPKPLHHQPAYAAGHDPASFPHSVRAAQRVLSLPMSADLTEAQQDTIVYALRDAARCRAVGRVSAARAWRRAAASGRAAGGSRARPLAVPSRPSAPARTARARAS